MARPAFVFCDTDASIQFLLVKQVRPLQVLQSQYGIRPLIVPEVEIELASHRRLGRRIAPELKRALTNGVISVLSKELLEAYYGGASAALAAENALGQISKIGTQLAKYVDNGEAFTLGAAIELGVPALSHDASAIAVLKRAGLPIPSPVLRAFDLVALCYQIKQMTEHECDDFRKALAAEKEHLPQCFKSASFEVGLNNFTPRLTDFKAADVGQRDPMASGFEKVLVL